MNTTGYFLGKGHVSAGNGDKYYIALFPAFPLAVLTKEDSDNAIVNLYTFGIQFLDGSFLYFQGWQPKEQGLIPGASLNAQTDDAPASPSVGLYKFNPAGFPISIQFDNPPFNGTLVGPNDEYLGPTSNWWAHADTEFVGDVQWKLEVITPGTYEWPSCEGFQQCCPGCDLRQLYVPELSLTSCDFQRANLASANFQGTYLDNCRFSHANLTAANFIGASLKAARFDGVDMTVIFNQSLEGTALRNASFVGAKLTGLDLTRVNSHELQGAVFDSASMDGVNLSGIDLSGASFKAVDLRKVRMNALTTLVAAKMSQADLSGVTLPAGIDMHQADLTGANLAGANFEGAVMYGVKFDNTDLTSTRFGANPIFRSRNGGPPSGSYPRTSFVGATLPADIIGVDWSSLDLTDTTLLDLGEDLSGLKAQYSRISGNGVDLVGATLTGADFSNSDLAKVDFSNSYFADKASEPVATFEGATIQNNTNFSGAKLVGANFENIQASRTGSIPAVNFSSAYLVNALFTEANLVKASFAGAQLYGTAMLDHADLQGADFSNSILAGLNLNEAHLRGAVFDGAILINATLKEVDLRPVDGNPTRFTGANLIGTDFRGAQLDSANLDSAEVALDLGVPFFMLKDLANWVPDLDKNLLSAALGQVFLNRNRPLRGSAEAYAITPGSDWVIEQYPTYDLTLDSHLGQLSVAISSVVLFTMASSAAIVSALDAATLPPELVKAIEARGAKLAASAGIDVVTTGSAWSLTQIPSIANAVGYSRLNLSGVDGNLTAFGAELMVSRLGPDNKLQLEIVDVTPTKLTSDELGPGTVCPNGTTYSAQRVSWTEMMTARSPATPPTCVPSPDRWCTPGTFSR